MHTAQVFVLLSVVIVTLSVTIAEQNDQFSLLKYICGMLKLNR